MESYEQPICSYCGETEEHKLIMDYRFGELMRLFCTVCKHETVRSES